jgi:hypothetical protein
MALCETPETALSPLLCGRARYPLHCSRWFIPSNPPSPNISRERAFVPVPPTFFAYDL